MRNMSCLGCEKRYCRVLDDGTIENCHSTCELYLRELKQNEEEREKRRKRAEEKTASIEIRNGSFKRMMRKKGQK